TLSHLSCESYQEGKSISDLTNPVSSIVIKGKKDYTLTLYAKTEKDATVHLASSSETVSVFTLSDRQAEPLTADTEVLIGNAENPERKN
ncbi:MAG: hypothetical protein J0651_04340, partial [Actinobacteria bacterium]|nr:hypothetical protein [Actinomycetota bacterium]